MKRTISLILSFVILLCVYPFTSVQAAVADDGYDYIFLNHTSFSVDNGWSGAENSTNGYSGKVLRAGAEGAGNKSNTVTQNFTVSAPAVGYIYGEEESRIVVNADVDENCAGNLSIFVVGYNMNDGCVVDSITPYELTVEKNKSAALTFDTPASKEGIVYKVLVWKKQSFHPLCLTLNLKTN